MTDFDVPDNWVLLETVTIVKALDEDGVPRVYHECTGGLNSWEAIGMCIWASDVMRSSMVANLE